MCWTKVLTPGFYARKDMKTPVVIAATCRLIGVGSTMCWCRSGHCSPGADDRRIGVAERNHPYAFLHARGHFRIEPWLWSRIVRKLVAAAAMAAVLWMVREQLDPSSPPRPESASSVSRRSSPRRNRLFRPSPG